MEQIVLYSETVIECVRAADASQVSYRDSNYVISYSLVSYRTLSSRNITPCTHSYHEREDQPNNTVGFAAAAVSQSQSTMTTCNVGHRLPSSMVAANSMLQ